MTVTIDGSNYVNNVQFNQACAHDADQMTALALQQGVLSALNTSTLSHADQQEILQILQDSGKLQYSNAEFEQAMASLSPSDRGTLDRAVDDLRDAVADMLEAASKFIRATDDDNFVAPGTGAGTGEPVEANPGEGAGEIGGAPAEDTGWKSSFEGIGGPGGWLRAIARILGEMLDIKADNLTKMAEKMANDEKNATDDSGGSEGAAGSEGAGGTETTGGGKEDQGTGTTTSSTDGTQSSATVEYQAAAKEFSIAMEACVNAIKTLGDACNTAVRK